MIPVRRRMKTATIAEILLSKKIVLMLHSRIRIRPQLLVPKTGGMQVLASITPASCLDALKTPSAALKEAQCLMLGHHLR
jgi:hypothetical protein